MSGVVSVDDTTSLTVAPIINLQHQDLPKRAIQCWPGDTFMTSTPEVTQLRLHSAQHVAQQPIALVLVQQHAAIPGRRGHARCAVHPRPHPAHAQPLRSMCMLP